VENNDDASEEYAIRVGPADTASEVEQMEAWTRDMSRDQLQSQPEALIPLLDEGRPLPPAKPDRVTTEKDAAGVGAPDLPDESTLGTVMRNVSEIPKQIVGGVDDAAKHLFELVSPLNDLAIWLNDNVADLRYEISKPKTGTGELTRSVSEFLTGFVPAFRALKGLGAIKRGMTAGAIADFTVRDPSAGRLADIWKQANLPENVLTDYLSSSMDDSAMESRFKNTLEGVLVGGAFEGVFLAARALRAAKNTPGVKEAEEQILRERYGELTEQELKDAGLWRGAEDEVAEKPAVMDIAEYSAKPAPSPNAGIVSTAKPKTGVAKRKVDDAAAAVGNVTDPRALIRARKGQPLPEDFEVYVNFNRIDEPDQIKFAMGKMAEKMKLQVDDATRGEISHKETIAMAEDMGMTVEQLLSRRKGQGFNAEEALAARQLWAASGEKLVEAAKKAADKNAGPLDQFAFRRAMAVHAAIQSEVLGARAETARALSSWRIPAGGGIERARAIQQMLTTGGGTDTSAKMAGRLAILANEGASPATIARFAEKGFVSASVDAIRETFINGLLSSPKTHIVNVSSNSLVALQQIYERQAASGVRAILGGDGTHPGEALAMAHGMVSSVKDAFRMSAKALRTGETTYAFNKVDTQRQFAVSADAFGMAKETGLGRFVDYLGTAIRVPTRLLGAEDEFFKTVGYRMELHAQSLRMAASEGHTGLDLAKRMKEIIDNPPETVRINAADAAMYQTFTNETGVIGQKIMDLRNVDSPLNPMVLILPFVRTPVNIARYAFERSPFAPLVGQWRADIAAGGARADIALARMSTGTAIMMAAMDIADTGVISGEGPKDRGTKEAMLRQGWQPFSVKVGDRWYSYNRTDPFGMTVGFAASITEAIRRGEMDEDDVDEWQEVVGMSIAAVSQATISKTYMEGFSNFVEAMSDPERYSPNYINKMMASFLPITSLNSAIKNVVDPVQRDVQSPADAVRARIAGLSENLPPRRNLWGEEITSESGLGKAYDFASPVASKPHKDLPIDREIVRLGEGPQRITKKTSFDGVMVNMRFYPQAYSEYSRLAGNALKHPAWGMGAKDYLNAVVSGAHPMSAVYQTMPDEVKKDFISGTIKDYRALAQREILADPRFANFAAEVAHLKTLKQNSMMPAGATNQ